MHLLQLNCKVKFNLDKLEYISDALLNNWGKGGGWGGFFKEHLHKTCFL